MSGKLIGVGVGPGDPELLTIKAVRAIESADVIAFHARPKGTSTARAIAEQYFQPQQHLELLEYPVTTGQVEHPLGYAGAMAQFYADITQRLREHLQAGKTVAVLALGDPMLYSSYQHIHRVLAAEFPAEIIPGIPSITAAANVLGQPLSEDEEILTVLPGTLSQEELTARLGMTDAAVVMKLGRNFSKVRTAITQAGLAHRAFVLIRVGMSDQRMARLDDLSPEEVPYFAVVVIPHEEPQLVDASSPASTSATGTSTELETNAAVASATPVPHQPGEVVVIGLGPGPDQWLTPEAVQELRQATDIVGYDTYVRRVPNVAGQTKHASDNKVEAERAAFALELAKRGQRVAVVSSGDPGVFAMAAAVLEVAEDPLWAEVPVRIIPGMTAAQAVASRVGAPLGHDFGMVSLSNRLKPWEVVERRIRALAQADMAFACYNPASKQRRWQVVRLKEIMLEYQQPTIPVIVARAVGSDQEQVQVTTLEHFDPEIVDMRTMIIMGASTTKWYQGPTGPRVYTSRYYGQ
ncbi:MAG: precorrin-3B C(17)-methyltransferase [Corynebacterium sp.]|nr:precorrin-3B C(17)-methyltransferase [Corynebacterium sp.]